MNKLILGIGMVMTATALAQDAEMTPEQIEAKCAAEGGCITVTRDGLISVLQLAFTRGLRACNSNI